jgi:alpha-galactosidase
MQRSKDTLHLRGGGTSVILDISAPGLPSIVHWGEDLGDLQQRDVDAIAMASLVQRVSGGLDVPARLTLLPQESFGWQGTPGLTGSRHGKHFSSALEMIDLKEDRSSVVIDAADQTAQLSLRIALSIDDAGLVSQTLMLTNTGDDDYDLIDLCATFPLPASATEILDTTGRHLRERTPQRHALTAGRYQRESRKGRPGADATLLLYAGAAGFGFERGLAHAVHLAWSGNHRLAAERLSTGTSTLQAGELLAAGEIRLAPGQSYTSPVAVASWGEGLNALAARFHTALRARPRHPKSPRPVTLNTWEAVYFDHDLDRLTALADAAARVGVERYVLDDGWFLGRSDDTAGLGDWFVDEKVWPDGLGPLIDRVVHLGMQFGLWVEPEMVNSDSALARQHPDWILQAAGRLPLEGRQQQVLDLSNPEAYAYILGRLLALLDEYPIAYLKWDHNRDLLEAGSTRTGAPATHENVVALYRMLDELKVAHPGLEIESCASGGARVDLGILDHTDRIWTSDCIDPIERLVNQRYTSMLVPYELMGAHIGGPHNHSTGRRHDLSLRAGVAILGHLGIEWDISTLTDGELSDVASWVATHKEFRELFHTGAAISVDLPDPSMDLRGVVATDRSSAFFIFTQVTTSNSYPAGPLTFAGLDDATRYSVRLSTEPSTGITAGQSPLPWTRSPLELTGKSLRTIGVQSPVLRPEHIALIHITAV